MLKKMNGKISAIVLATAVAVAPTLVGATEITLKFDNQDLTIVGEYTGFQNDTYIIVNELGEMRIPAGMVTCQGDACMPVAAPAQVNG